MTFYICYLWICGGCVQGGCVIEIVAFLPIKSWRFALVKAADIMIDSLVYLPSVKYLPFLVKTIVKPLSCISIRKQYRRRSTDHRPVNNYLSNFYVKPFSSTPLAAGLMGIIVIKIFLI